MTKYLPKDSGYKQMYLINKFEKNIMETALSNMKNDERKSDTVTTAKKVSQETQTPVTPGFKFTHNPQRTTRFLC